MKLFSRKKNDYRSVLYLSEDERERMIERLETERLYVTLDIEELMTEIAKRTGKRRYRLKRQRLGKRPQDYIPVPEHRR